MPLPEGSDVISSCVCVHCAIAVCNARNEISWLVFVNLMILQVVDFLS